MLFNVGNVLNCISKGVMTFINGHYERTTMYSCTLMQNNTLMCTQTVDASCDHTMGLGVMCRTHQEIGESENNL